MSIGITGTNRIFVMFRLEGQGNAYPFLFFSSDVF